MSTYEFESTVLATLADLKAEPAETRAEVRGITARLDKVNGRVADQERHIGEMQIELAERSLACPLVDAVEVRIRPLEEALAAERASEKTSKTWLDRVGPFIWVALGVFGFLVLERAPQLAKAVFH